jgi:hypothetical protein
VTKAILVAQFLPVRAWWRLDSAGASALHVARSVVSLLDAAAYLQRWQLADEASAGPRDLLTELVRAAKRNPKAAPIGIPRQVTAPEVPAPAR